MRLLLLSFISLLQISVYGQLQIYPFPQKAETGPGSFFTNKYSPEGANDFIQWGRLAVDDAKLQQPGAYRIVVSKDAVAIDTFDNVSKFYALQTLSQIAVLQEGGKYKIPQCRITDYPDVRLRGTVEGFYGTPWSFEDRVSQLKFYGKMKLNTYIYGPKDDPYHSSPHWRDHYPADKAEQISKLVKVANDNKVHFVWAIHPGKDIQWHMADSMAVLNKFEAMYQLGVRAFAVFFDDISGAGTSAAKQAGLLNFLQQAFVEKKKDVLPLIMCPTEYNKAWADPKEGTYLDILGEKLDPEIYIMWTGNTVVSDITAEGLEWVNKRIRRPAFIWWNFPVSDYVRNHLLMGAAYGLDTTANTLMSGFVSNPMEHAEASKVAIFGVAQYAWNMHHFDPEACWQLACKFMMPRAWKAFERFCANNADPGLNGHGYRRRESQEIKSDIDAYLRAFKTHNGRPAGTDKLIHYFTEIKNAEAQIETDTNNTALLKEIKPWLAQFHLLGLAGLQALHLAAESLKKNNTRNTWIGYVKLQNLFADMDSVSSNNNQNPYQKGIKTGTLVLKPFVDTVSQIVAKRLMKDSQTAPYKNMPSNTTHIFTNTNSMKEQPVNSENNSVSISPVLEFVTLRPNDYIGLCLDKGRTAETILYNLEGEKVFASGGELQISADGNDWQTISSGATKQNGKTEITDSAVRYIRLINMGPGAQQIKLRQFEINTKNDIESSTLASDNNLDTYQEILPGQAFTIQLPDDKNKKTTLRFLLDTRRHSILIKDGKKILYRGKEHFVRIPFTKKRKLPVTITAVDGPVRLYEVM